MARRSPELTVVITATAQRELLRIWDYKAESRGERQADAWDDFLRRTIDGLSTDYDQARPVEGFPELRHVIARKRSSSHGHVIVYEVDSVGQAVNILHVFHTRQDLRGRLEQERG